MENCKYIILLTYYSTSGPCGSILKKFHSPYIVSQNHAVTFSTTTWTRIARLQ